MKQTRAIEQEQNEEIDSGRRTQKVRNRLRFQVWEKETSVNEHKHEQENKNRIKKSAVEEEHNKLEIVSTFQAWRKSKTGRDEHKQGSKNRIKKATVEEESEE